jgi:hypothetical protein
MGGGIYNALSSGQTSKDVAKVADQLRDILEPPITISDS